MKSLVRIVCLDKMKRPDILTLLNTTLLLTVLCITQSVRLSPACRRDDVLRQVDTLLADTTFEAHYLTINREMTLSIWLVEPEIDPHAQESEIAENTKKALLRGVSLAHKIVSRIPCTRTLFENINPMIVDRHYNNWYIDIIPIKTLLFIEDSSDAERMAAIQSSGTEYAYRRSIPPTGNTQSSPEKACAWSEARVAIQKQFGAVRRNTAAYLLIGDPPPVPAPWNDYATSDVVVQAQWDVHTLEETGDTIVLKILEPFSTALACLSPPVDKLEIFVVDETGQLIVYGIVPGSLIRERIFPLPKERILLHREE